MQGMQEETNKDVRFREKMRQVQLKVQDNLEKRQQNHKLRNDQQRTNHKFYVKHKMWLYMTKRKNTTNIHEVEASKIWAS